MDADTTPTLPLDGITGIFGAGYEYGCRYTGITGSYTGEQVTEVTLRLRYTPRADFWLINPMMIQPYLYIGGKRWWAPKATTMDPLLNDGYFYEFTWPFNPSTACTWTVSDIEDFNTGGSSYTGWVVGKTDSGRTIATTVAAQLGIKTVGTDARVAFGCVDDGENWWAPVDLQDPATGGDWSKTAGATYLCVLRQLQAGTQKLYWRQVDQPGTFVPGAQSFRSLKVGMNQATGRIKTLGAEETPAGAILFRKATNGLVSEDGQPYNSINDDGAQVPEGLFTRVHSQNTETGTEDAYIEQEFTPDASDDYEWDPRFLRALRHVRRRRHAASAVRRGPDPPDARRHL